MVSVFPSPHPSGLDHRPLGMGLEGMPAQEESRIQEYSNWLQFHRLWGSLPDLARKELARSLHLLRVEAGTLIYREGQSSLGLYLLKWGP